MDTGGPSSRARKSISRFGCGKWIVTAMGCAYPGYTTPLGFGPSGRVFDYRCYVSSFARGCIRSFFTGGRRGRGDTRGRRGGRRRGTGRGTTGRIRDGSDTRTRGGARRRTIVCGYPDYNTRIIAATSATTAAYFCYRGPIILNNELSNRFGPSHIVPFGLSGRGTVSGFLRVYGEG